MTTRSECPILFNGEMIKAILDGRKTQTRRIVKLNDSERAQLNGKNWHLDDPNAVLACPLGQVGDRLWVRETWAGPHAYDHLPPRLVPANTRFHYAATEDRGGLLWRPSIHMPRVASRITLAITEVRLERLQQIRNCDCVLEGVDDRLELARNKFQSLWNQIYGNWDANPWVWVIEFKPINDKANQGDTVAVNIENTRK